MKRTLALALAVVASSTLALNSAEACFSHVSTRDAFVVNMPGTTTITAQTEDLISIELPVESSEVDVTVSGGLEEVAAGPEVNGAQLKIFKVKKAGKATISVRGTRIKGYQQKIEATERPRTRC